MIRSFAALFAKKTAIVAITGVTVIGGATLALAVEGDPPEEPVVDAAGAEDCTGEEAWDEDLQACVDPDAPTTCDPGLVLDAETDTCVPDPDVPVECDPASLAEGETCPDDEEQDTDGDLAEGTEGDEPVAEHPENHGKYVSEAAQGGGECAGLSGRDKGQCVADVARSDIGKTTAEEEPAPAEETVIEQSAPVDEPAAAVVTEQPAKGKPAHAGGKGKGGKG